MHCGSEHHMSTEGQGENPRGGTGWATSNNLLQSEPELGFLSCNYRVQNFNGLKTNFWGGASIPNAKSLYAKQATYFDLIQRSRFIETTTARLSFGYFCTEQWRGFAKKRKLGCTVL